MKMSKRLFAIFAIVFILATGLTTCRRSTQGPRPLNQPTKAREARPFSTEPDPRFAPLPLEPEKHGK